MNWFICLHARFGVMAVLLCSSMFILFTFRAWGFTEPLRCLMKMWLESRISRKSFSTSICNIPTVRRLLNLGDKPVVSVSITSLSIG